MSAQVSFVVPPEEDGRRVDSVVAIEALLPRAQVARLIAAGAVLVDGVTVSKSDKVSVGQTVLVTLPSEPAPPEAEDIAIAIVYEDDALMVVSKPAGLVVHPAPGHEGGTMVNALIAHGAAGGEAERPGIVHRLDAGTSGLLVVAKGEEPHARLSEALAAREVTRVYVALIEGTLDTDLTTIDAPIGRSHYQRKMMAVVADGKPARTHIEIVERLPATSYVEATLETGRTHQIRVHLSAVGNPVVGDPVYGGRRALAERLGLKRPFLHAARLRFRHPTTGEDMAFEDPMPPDLSAALEAARGG